MTKGCIDETEAVRLGDVWLEGQQEPYRVPFSFRVLKPVTLAPDAISLPRLVNGVQTPASVVISASAEAPMLACVAQPPEGVAVEIPEIRAPTRSVILKFTADAKLAGRTEETYAVPILVTTSQGQERLLLQVAVRRGSP